MRDFLVEIQTEELPPKAIKRLASSFLDETKARLEKAELGFATIKAFATPRRLALLITQLSERQADVTVERKGPALSAAYDASGQPTAACLGFARSCGAELKDLVTLTTSQGEWVGYHQLLKGRSIHAIMPEIIEQAIQALPIPKRMRWGLDDVEFSRPVHSILMIYGEEVIPATILGLETGNKTLGHRFHSHDAITILSPARYVEALLKNHVMADMDLRKEKIRDQIEHVVQQTLGDAAQAQIDPDLLDEVTGLVEWPVALCGHFDETFLGVPQEALISAMQDHQRYFPIIDREGKLLPHFVTISNIESKKPEQVIAGNERVIRARLSDAKFFYDTDLKQSLTERVPELKKMIFQQKLGTLYDKVQRVSALAVFMAEKIGVDVSHAKEASQLAKADLTTQLVGEFPDLQGIAGYYYALHDQLPNDIALAIKEHYQPRYSGATLPTSALGAILAIADRVDTLVGIFGIQQVPTGDKDPFALRRAALGLLRILIEKKIDLDLLELFEFAKTQYGPLENKTVVSDVLLFTLERLKPWYQDQGISPDVFSAVAALNITRPYDFHCRVQAVQAFKQLPEAEALSVANKRVSNILAKYTDISAQKKLNHKLFENDIERLLADAIQKQHDEMIDLSYADVLSKLATLREPVDSFFDNVMVMTDDKEQRDNRLLLLKQLRALFLHVADIALLQ